MGNNDDTAAICGTENIASEKLNSRSDLETMVTRTHRPERKTIVLTPKEIDLLKASKKAAHVPKTSLVQVVHLDPVTRKTTCVPVDLPDLPPEQSSGQDCRQPVLQRSGPPSRESSCQTSSQQCQSDSSDEFDLTPIAVKTEPMDGDHITQIYEEMVVHRTPEAFTVLPVEVNMPPVGEDGNTQGFDEREVLETPQEFAVLPEEVKMEPDWGYPETLVQVKTEPPDS